MHDQCHKNAVELVNNYCRCSSVPSLITLSLTMTFGMNMFGEHLLTPKGCYFGRIICTGHLD